MARPKFTLYELLGWNPSLGFLQAEDFKPMQTQEARTLVRNLVESTPDKYDKSISRFATGIITQIVAGHRITSDDDPYLRMSNMIYEAMSKTGPPGSSPIDFFPLLQHFPLWFPGTSHMDVEQQQVGEAMPSFVLEKLEQMKEGDDEENLKGAAATMFGAGEATTWTTLSIFILAMVLHPECQAKAQEQIDSVVGGLRLPDFEDRDDLPLVEGILQETLRWNPGVPLGLPHRAMEDDFYRGMFIPKGSLIFANIRGMALEESVYSNPESFNPERYIPKPAGKGEPYFSNVPFGFGRRISDGRAYQSSD
ncbi:O-methylsterigmatocystin oxidoreductase [Mycena venus]|uniref:O-methylsterigmatocystin oxidoreductase n=1 Tax=Mycena venus TaxID=2733690 RepID=A0A8H6TW57_9AGAR|nr:O-methylsterigmatocystin oxidoreductase [Mycena venus]